jgi:hypothetical protein
VNVRISLVPADVTIDPTIFDRWTSRPQAIFTREFISFLPSFGVVAEGI